MKQFIKNLIVAFIIFAGIATVSAAPSYIYQRSILPELDNTYYIGTTSPSNLRYNGAFNNLTISGTCTGCGAASQWTTSGSNIYYTTGKVGVGTTSPFATLSVSTTSQSSAPMFTVASTTHATLFTVLANGAVGIATTTPGTDHGASSRLVVAGNETITGELHLITGGGTLKLYSGGVQQFYSNAAGTALSASINGADGSAIFAGTGATIDASGNITSIGRVAAQDGLLQLGGTTGDWNIYDNGSDLLISNTISNTNAVKIQDSAFSVTGAPDGSNLLINGATQLVSGDGSTLSLIAGQGGTVDLYSNDVGPGGGVNGGQVNISGGAGDSDPGSGYLGGNVVINGGAGDGTIANDAFVRLASLRGGVTIGSYTTAPTASLVVSGKIGAGVVSPITAIELNTNGVISWDAGNNTSVLGLATSTLNGLKINNGSTGTAPDTLIASNLYTATADKVLNSTSPTTAFSSTKVGTTVIPANSLKVGKKFNITGAGYYSTPLANTSTVTITTSIASSTATTISTVTTAAFPASATNLPFTFNMTCTVRSIGAAATLVCDGSFDYATALSAVAKTSNSLSTVSTIKFDSTVAETLDVKGSWSAVTTQTATVQESGIDYMN